MKFEVKHSKQVSICIGFNNEFFFKEIKFDYYIPGLKIVYGSKSVITFTLRNPCMGMDRICIIG